MSPTIQPSVEPEQGAVKQQEALEQMVPIQNEIAPTNPQQMAEQAVQTAAPPRQPEQPTVIRNLLRLPYKRDELLDKAGIQRSPMAVQQERKQNVGLLWEALAQASPDPLTRAIAKTLLEG
jgi:hypothetical protein